ncbi:hypothetical protein HGRIS_010105 [Hohenbuehelia grisea]|uniref:Fungal-type protein kinase domain-containing protein n=1 Tax=Hohenbuehelia grisea TaxID=104357 RepID=A0ABR3J384_9AGAR
MSASKRPPEGSPPFTPAKKAVRDFYNAMHNTPFRLKSNVISVHTESMNTNQKEEKERRQEELKDLMMEEFRSATYEADWVSSQYCPVNGSDVDTVLALLKKQKVYTETGGQFQLTSWARGGETVFYKSFARLLNNIVDAFARCFPKEYDSSSFTDTEFVPYDKYTTDSVSGEHQLKPDIVLVRKLCITPEEPKVSWLSIYFVVEVKDKWSELLWQAATYARCLFAASDHRVFIPILCLNQKTGEFRLCFFHRSGVLATHSMRFTSTLQGFRDLVATIMGMWLWTTPGQAGYVPEQSPLRFSLSNTSFYIHQILCRRQAIRGRGTIVYAVKRAVKPPDHEAFPDSLLNNDGPIWKKLNPFDRKEDVPPVGTQKVDIPTLPDSFIIKCSHQLRERISEVDVFSAVQGFIGIPRVLGEYQPMAFETPADKSPCFWKVRQDSPEVLPYESRVHRHLIIESEGVRLSPELTFQQVGYAMVHAMIGHCALFTEGNIMHRDVSNGNIVFLTGNTRSDWKIPPILENVLPNNDCTAVLIDGDASKTWGSLRPTSSDRSGTLPFISRRLTESWGAREAILHTPIDDLESFVLVLVYNALAWTPKKRKSSREAIWWSSLHKGDLIPLWSMKEQIFLTLKQDKEPEILKISRILAEFHPLISAWMKEVDRFVEIAAEYLRKRQRPDKFTQLFKDAYVQLIRIGLDAAAKLADVPVRSLYEDGAEDEDEDEDEDEAGPEDDEYEQD